MSAIVDFLARRRSVPPLFLAEPAPDAAQLETILTIGARVPDHGKVVPWRFIVFQGEGRKLIGNRLADLVKARDPGVSEERLTEERGRFTRAPLVIVVVSKPIEHPKAPRWEQELSAGASCFALELAAHALGFGANWFTEWLAFDDEAAALLGVGTGERIAGVIHIGTPTMSPQDRPRPALADVVTYWQG